MGRKTRRLNAKQMTGMLMRILGEPAPIEMQKITDGTRTVSNGEALMRTWVDHGLKGARWANENIMGYLGGKPFTQNAPKKPEDIPTSHENVRLEEATHHYLKEVSDAALASPKKPKHLDITKRASEAPSEPV